VARPFTQPIKGIPMSLRKTPFLPCHEAADGRIIDFGGWALPVQYKGIIEEHRRVRDTVGLFDVSHMGEVRFKGPRALESVRHIVTNDVDIPVGRAQYTAMCNNSGGIVDDVIVYRLAEEDILICVNAANREKDFRWMVAHNPFPDDAAVTDESDDWAQVALQGRRAPSVLQTLTAADVSGLSAFGVCRATIADVDGCIVARTGYTGEDGYEVFLPPDGAMMLWDAVMSAGAAHDIQPIGLGARDTLRLEMKYCLYGNDIDDTTTPLEAGLGWVTKLAKADFVGRSALVAQRQAGVTRRLVCLEVDKRIARPHSTIQADGEVVGEVTSGTRSPSMGTNIALGYVSKHLARPGTEVQIDIRGRFADARVVKPPFYKRPY
jgi:aminomethyltransferase